MAQVWSEEEEERSARFTWNISCQRGKRGGHTAAHLASSAYLLGSLPDANAATAARQHGLSVHLLPDHRKGVLTLSRGASSSPSYFSFLFGRSFSRQRTIICVAVRTDRRGRGPRRRRAGAGGGVAFYQTTPPIFLCRKIPFEFAPPFCQSPSSRAYRSLSRRRSPPLAHPSRPEPHQYVNPQHRRLARAQLWQQLNWQIDQEGPTELN